jgi:hypothetical protein
LRQGKAGVLSAFSGTRELPVIEKNGRLEKPLAHSGLN